MNVIEEQLFYLSGLETELTKLQEEVNRLSSLEQRNSVYTKRINDFGVMGEHVDHLIAFYKISQESISAGVPICFEERPRCSETRTSISKALEEIAKIKCWLETYTGSSLDCLVEMKFERVEVWPLFIVFRYISNHTLHHNGVIRGCLGHFAFETSVADDFGMDAATIAYTKTLAS